MLGENKKTAAEYEADITKTFRDASKYGAQDIFLIEGERPAFRVKGVMSKMSNLPRWDIETFDVFILKIVMQGKDVEEEEGKSAFERIVEKMDGSHDFNISFGRNHLRCHMYSAFPKGTEASVMRKMQAVINIRVVPQEIPNMGTLNLPDISSIFSKKGGLMLVSGRTNDGKSTTVAAIVNEFNRMTDKHRIILTLEDPVEFVHKNHNSWVIQRRVGENVPTYAKGTEDALREEADIVFIGELRRAEEMHNALRLAEVGKIVVSTIHANSVADTIERYVNEFSGDDQEKTRTRLTENLIGILHQNLISVAGEQYPLSSMLLIDNERVRNELRKSNDRTKLERMIAKSDVRYGMTRDEGFELLKERGILTENDRNKYL